MTDQCGATDIKSLSEAIMAMRNQVPKEEFEIPGVGKIWIHGLTTFELGQMRQIYNSATAQSGEDLLTDARMFQMGVRDSNGVKLFKVTDVNRLVELPAVLVRRVVRIIDRLSGIGPESAEQIRKNSSTPAQTESGEDS